ncbi:MAG: ATP synthase F1 subunit epsilon [Clostridiales bacterium]|nr:ATP synthase F1 subunit epsilon [Clostridiales bacterium]
MAEKKLHLRIITPDRTKLDEEVGMVILRCTTGNLGVLPRHEARSAVLDVGILRILNDGTERWLAVYGGLAVIQDNAVIVLANDADWPEEIDHARANADREHIEQRMREWTDDIELQNDHLLLRRALVQIEVSASSFMEKDSETD